MDNDLPSLYLNTTVLFESNGDFLASLPISLSTQGPIHVITAWNPGDERPSRVVNENANSRLRELLSPGYEEPEDLRASLFLSDDKEFFVGVNSMGSISIMSVNSEDEARSIISEIWS